MNDKPKLSDNTETHYVMDALKEVLDAYKDSLGISYELKECNPEINGRYIAVIVRVPVK